MVCCKGKTDKESVIGKYVNVFEPETIHFVELRPDSTYFHYYKKNNELERINSGKWKLSIRDSKTEIIFRKWITFGYDSFNNSCFECHWAVKLEKGELIFDVDLPDEMNFKKR